MHITPETQVGELVADDVNRTRIFERLGIDYCCGGRRSLADACSEKDLDPGTVAQMLAATAEGPTHGDLIDWKAVSLSDLIEHIKETHHAFLREELPRLKTLLAKVVRAHGKATPWIVEVKQIFENIKPELEAHLQKEEDVVFPMIRMLEKGDPLSETVEVGDDLIHLMEDEHDEVGKAMAQMRALSNDYTPPEGACNSFRAVVQGLADLEADMHQHVHKENNILFPQARKFV